MPARQHRRPPTLALLLLAVALASGVRATWSRGRTLDAAPASPGQRAGVDGLLDVLTAQRFVALWSDLPAARLRPRQFGLQSILPPAVVHTVPDLRRAQQALLDGEALLVDGADEASIGRRVAQLEAAATRHGVDLVVRPGDRPARPRRVVSLVMVAP